MNQKGKVFSLIALSGAMLFSFAIFGKNFDFSSVRADNLNTTVEDVIDFDDSNSKKTEFKVINDKNVSRTTTKQGDYVYMVNDSGIRPSSGALATFRGTFESSYELGTLVFAKDAKASELYQFQNVSGISIVSNYKISDVLIKVSDDGTNFYNFDSISITEKDGDNYVASLTFDEPIQDGYLMLEETTTPLATAEFKRVVLSYTCQNGYVPAEKHSIEVEPTSNGTIEANTLKKHKKGDTVNFSVEAASGYVIDEVYTVPETALSVSGSNYSFVMPEDDVSIKATFKLAPQVAYNVSAQASSGGSVSFSRTQYYENESVAFTVTPNSTYEIDQVSTNPNLTVNGSDGSYSFTMPASDVEVIVSYKQVSSLSFSGNYQTEFDLGDTFNHDNLVVTANYVGGSSKVVTDYSISTPDMLTAGSKTVTVTYNGVSNTYQINVTAPDAIERIEVTGTYKTNYHFNDTVDHTGVIVNAVYTSGNRVDVTSDCTFIDPSMSSWTVLGKKVTVNYLTFSTTYNIKIFTLDSISLSGQYTSSNTTFNYGDEFSLNGITVEATYKCSLNGSTETIYEDVTSKVSCSGYNMYSVSNSQTVTVTYDDGHDSKSTTYTIKVKDVLDHISYVAGTGAKTNYKVGETFSSNGFTVYKHMKSGAQSDVTTDATFNAPAFSEEGNYNVVVSYPGVESINIPVTVEKGEEPTPSTTVYKNSTTATLYINGDGSGYEVLDSGEAISSGTIYFHWTLSGTTYTFTKDSGQTIDDTSFGANYIFRNGLASNTGTVNSNGDIVVKIGFQNKTFNKQ